MVDIDQDTQIGADGQRHPTGTQPTDAADYRREPVVPPIVLDTATITVDSEFFHPTPATVLSGTFQAPDSGKVNITTDLHGRNAGYAYANLSLVVGIPENGLLRGTGQYAPLVEGAERRVIGRAGLDTVVDLQRVDQFDGLDPTETYQWQLESVVVGGMDTVSLTTPTGVVFIEEENRGYVFTSDAGAAAGIYPLTLGARPNWLAQQGPVLNELGTKIALPSGPYSLYRPAITPDGRYIIAATLGTGVAILDTTTDSITKTANPASGTTPYTSVCHSNTAAFVGFAGTGRIWRIDLTDGSWDASATPGRGIVGMCLNDDRTVLYAGGTDGVILRYPDLSNLATGVTFLDIGGRIECMVWGGDRIWVGLPNEIRSIHPTTFATIDSISVPATPNELRISSDYAVLYTILQNGMFKYYSTAAHTSLPANNEFDSSDRGTAGTAIAITSDEYIYICVDSKVEVFPGSTFAVLPEGGDGAGGIAPEFLDHGLTVTVTT